MKLDKEIHIKVELWSIFLLLLFTSTIAIIYLNNERTLDTMNEKVEFLHRQYGDFSLLDDRLNVLEDYCRRKNK